MSRLLESSPDSILPAHLHLLLWRTGIRIGSVRALDVDDIQSEEECIAVRHRPDTDTPLKNKENGERLIALKPKVCSALDDYVDVNRLDVTDEYGRKPLLATEHGRPNKNTIRETVYRWTRPCQYRGSCPYGRDMDDCAALSVRRGALKCPSSVSPHAVRRGSITHHLTEDVPEQVFSDRMNVSQRVLEDHYDRRDKHTKIEQRRGYLDKV